MWRPNGNHCCGLLVGKLLSSFVCFVCLVVCLWFGCVLFVCLFDFSMHPLK